MSCDPSGGAAQRRAHSQSFSRCRAVLIYSSHAHKAVASGWGLFQALPRAEATAARDARLLAGGRGATPVALRS